MFRALNVADISHFEKHVERLIRLIPSDGSTIDLEPLFHPLALQISAEFLFGRSTDSLLSGDRKDVEDYGNSGVLPKSIRESQHQAAGVPWFLLYRILSLKNTLMQLKVWMTAFPLQVRFFIAMCPRCHDYDHFRLLLLLRIIHCTGTHCYSITSLIRSHMLTDRLQHLRTNSSKKKYFQSTPSQKNRIDMYSSRNGLMPATTDRTAIRFEFLNIFLVGRDTTACLFSEVHFELPRHPDIRARLRKEIDQHIGDAPPTCQQLKDLR